MAPKGKDKEGAGAGERTKFFPPEELSKKAYLKSYEEYKELYDRSINEPESFWAEMAESLDWVEKWDKVFSWDDKEYKYTWFEGESSTYLTTASTGT